MRRIFLLAILFICLQAVSVQAAGEKVVSLGNDLSDTQKQQMLRIFGVKEDEVKMLVVTNKEERDYLQGVAPESMIGTRSISSAFVEQLEAGKGISVETYNITWVTKEMYAGALATAGVKDARVVAAAPFKVSGTAALTGITKAFEEISGKTLSPDAKKAANEELVKTGELGDSIGKDKAAILVQDIKEKIIQEKAKSPADIKQIIINVAGDLNINLSEAQINDLTSLMEKISKLNINVSDMNNQLKNITSQLQKIGKTQEEAKGIFQQILKAIENFINWLQNLFGGK